ncbi:MAG: type 2 isopentenyl-diphosphate Delta-isomerase [Candidatus Heimdallarchaeota archaeon]|nr:type 2 isopentenyl-diphosphate Delta-isomerase [Candidatus Heimdallarchaeota archaeon]
MDQDFSSNTSSRKDEHLKICVEKDVKYDNVTSGFDNFTIRPNILTKILPDDVDLSTTFLDKSMDSPLLIAGMTGGSEKGKEINKIIAKVCDEFNIGMGVGSQRAAIENPVLIDSFQVRDNAENIPILANLGIAQFSSGYTVKEAEKAVEMIDADGLAIHVNPLQELIQYDGNKNLINVRQSLIDLAIESKYPIIVKSVGTGFSKEDVKFLSSLNITAIDIAGAGGTNWKKIEMYRNPSLSDLSSALINWGIPTADCLITTVDVISDSSKKIIASGGIWNGMDAVKALMLGADYVAFALPALLAISKDSEAGLRKFVHNYILEMKIVLTMLGITRIEELRKKKNLLMRKTPH